MIGYYTPLKTDSDLEKYRALLTLDKRERSFADRQDYYRAYIISALFPPLGVYYLIKFAVSSNGDSEKIRAGVIACVITIVSILLSLWFFDYFFKQTSVINSGKSEELLKELITPANQQQLKDLFR